MNNASKFTAVTLAITLSLSAIAFAAPDSATDSHDDSSSITQAVGDTWVTTKVKTELATTDGVDSSSISVDTDDGVVTLTGVLSSDTEVKKAVAAAKSVDGVKQVDDAGLKTK